MTSRQSAKIAAFFFAAAVFRYWNLITPTKEAREYILRDFIPDGQMTAFLSALRQGTLLLWNGSIGAGAPVRDGLGLFYPLDVFLFFFLRDGHIVHHVFQYHFVLHVGLMGFFMYLLLRRLGTRALAAVAGGLVYSYNGYVLVHSMHLNIVATMTWLPVVFLFLEKGREEGKLACYAWAGVFLGVSVLVGHAQAFYYNALAVAVYMLYWLAVGWKGGETLGGRLKPLGNLAFVGLVTLGISAIQIIPAFKAGAGSMHATMGLDFKWVNPLAFYQLGMLVIPWGLDAVSDWNILVSERYAYMSWAALIFGLGAVAWRCEARTFAYVSLAAVALVLAMGDNSVLFKFFFDNVPGYGMYRYPSRILSLFVFGMAVLTGLGLDFFLSDRDPNEAREKLPGFLRAVVLGGLAIWTIATGSLTISTGWAGHEAWVHFVSQLALALVIVVCWWAVTAIGRTEWKRPAFGAGLVIVLLFDLWSPGSAGERVPSPDTLKPGEEAAVGLLREKQEEDGLFRIENHVLRESLLNRYGISAYNTGSRLVSGEYIDLMLASNDNPRILDLLNVRYVVGSKKEQAGERPRRKGFYPNLDLGPGAAKTVRIPGGSLRADRIEVVSSIRYGGHIPQGETVAEMTAYGRTGEAATFPIRAGVETAEWAVEDPKARVQHRPAAVASSWPMPGREGMAGHRYRAVLSLGRAMDISSIDLKYLKPDGELLIDRLAAGGRDLALVPEDRFEQVAPDIVRNRYARERAFLVRDARVVSDPEEMKRALRWFDPERVVLLSRPAALPEAKRAARPGEGRAEIASYSSWKISIEVETPVPQFLVVSETYHPWWRARIDGKETEVLKADHALRAVVVPEGRHVVEFRLVPVSFYLGAGVTLATLGVVVFLALRSRRGARAGAPSGRTEIERE